MKAATVYLALGSNLADRLANLRAAIGALEPAGVQVKQISSIYETEPVDYLNQPWFLNCVVQAETNLGPFELLHALRSIEVQRGSQKEIPKGPRLIDLDILLYDSETVSVSELQIPHPRMLLRRFILAPLAEIAPQLAHPNWPASAAELLSQLQDSSQVHRIDAKLLH
jgi:2-amino-4-hydroxy-6-hydroxymethyldihydropteridine diphosphokinase